VNPDFYTGDINWHDTSACANCWNLTTDFIAMSSQGYIVNDADGEVNLQF